MTIGVAELTYQARQVESYTFKGFEAFTAATLVYLAISLIITGLVTIYSKKILNPYRNALMEGFQVVWDNITYFMIGRLSGWSSGRPCSYVYIGCCLMHPVIFRRSYIGPSLHLG